MKQYRCIESTVLAGPFPIFICLGDGQRLRENNHGNNTIFNTIVVEFGEMFTGLSYK